MIGEFQQRLVRLANEMDEIERAMDELQRRLAAPLGRAADVGFLCAYA